MSEQNYANVQQQAELMKYISDNMKIPVLGAGGGFAPIGTLNYYMGTVAPQGWLICDGTVYNIADYPEFATFIASNYGSTNAFGGNGTTTFAVPDCRGEFARMIGTNSHENQGSGGEVGEHQDGTIHRGTHASDNMYISLNSISSKNNDYTYSQNDVRYIAGSTYAGTEANYANYTSRPTNTSWNFIVKATVSGDANGHVYSTDEQIVGTTEDGETIYEKTIKLQNVAMNYSHSISFAKDVIDCKISITLNQNQTIFANYYYSSDYYVTFNIYNGAIQFDCKWSSYQTFDDVRIVLQYTKTS